MSDDALPPPAERIVSLVNPCRRNLDFCGIVHKSRPNGAQLAEGGSGMARHEAADVRASERVITRGLLGGATLLASGLNLLLLSSAR